MTTLASTNTVPIPYITAVWSGMARADIEAGIAAGTILPSASVPRAGAMGGQGEVGAEPMSMGTNGDASVEAQAAGQMRTDVGGWFQALDPSLTTAAFDKVWERAGANDTERGSTLRGWLAQTLLGDATASDAALDAFVSDPAHRATVVDLGGMSGSEIADLASSDIGYRHALATMQPLAITGNRALFARANADGALDRFDPETGEQQVSDAWIGDRAKLLAWRASGEGAPTIDGSEDWMFVDHAVLDADGEPARFELRTGVEGAGQNQVVFGGAKAELLQGVAGSDRMYGGGGSDVMRGAAGADHLEGGDGDDLLMGGAGNDELSGDRGDDELEGGRGHDRLLGGRGNDMLSGGRGDDRLEGGAGDDLYLIEEGDGNDTIVDADGVGAIEFDGVEIGGSMALGDGGTWSSADGRARFSFDGVPGEKGTLTVTMQGAPGNAAERPAGVVTVQNWKNGDLGITLAETPAVSNDPDPGALSQTDHGVSVLASEDLLADAQTGETGNDTSVAAETGMNDAIAWGDGAGVGAVAASTAATTSSNDTAATLDAATISDTQSFGAEADAAKSLADTATFSGSDRAWDFSAALDAMLADSAYAASAVQPADVAGAIEAFDGVLEVPDIARSVAVGGDWGGDTVADAVTALGYADALAGDYDASDLGGETTWSSSAHSMPDIQSREFSRTGAADALSGNMRA